MSNLNTIVAVYKSHDEAETALEELRKSGFDMDKISVVAREYLTEAHVTGYYSAGDRMKFWGKTGGLWGGLLGFVAGSGFFLIPGIGPLLVAGPLVGMIAGALEGGLVGGGRSALGAGLHSQGVHKDSIANYETALRRGKFVVIAHGSAGKSAHAREIIERTNPESATEHPAKNSRTNIGRWENSLLP